MRPGKRKSDSRSSQAGPESSSSIKSTSNRLTNPSSSCKSLAFNSFADSNKESPV